MGSRHAACGGALWACHLPAWAPIHPDLADLRFAASASRAARPRSGAAARHHRRRAHASSLFGRWAMSDDRAHGRPDRAGHGDRLPRRLRRLANDLLNPNCRTRTSRRRQLRQLALGCAEASRHITRRSFAKASLYSFSSSF